MDSDATALPQTCLSVVVVDSDATTLPQTCLSVVAVDSDATALPQTCLSVVVVDSDARLSGLLNFRPRWLERVVCTHQPSSQLLNRAADLAVTVQSFADLEREGGRAQIQDRVSRSERDIL